ncbi:3-ketodihydrosphingosine reductase [Araneus ventricosus]|uniref:3-dehydrosphinganine reductase n=1 Tax=Araneus ventricosus TaxID=182803 RepID=A0A4Y2DCY9_ARAVE|nr:3-ketodihydrosphingosine reductase [Araneus ventricosus]
MIYYFALGVICVAVSLLYRKGRTFNLKNDHCLVTGGSSGIGLAIAIQAAKMGANVTIVARSQERLDAAKGKICSEVQNSQQKVLTFSSDISDDTNLKDIVIEAEKQAGPITILINCAGTSLCSRFEETPMEDFKKMINVNFLGSINMTQAVVPLMKERKHGRIAFVSSLAGLIGIYGYSAYSGSKFALLGAAEALQMEVKSYNISVTVSFPPDTDTPGFAEEIKNKPIETVRISESAGLYSAEDVATKTLNDVLNKKFMSSIGFEGWMMCTACSASTPTNSFVELLVQIFTAGIFRLAAFVYLKQCDYTIKKCPRERSTE